MALTSLYIQSLRNINETELAFSAKNVFYGDNGSGKTSILEAIYMLGTGRSFRTTHSHVIQNQAPALYLRGVLTPKGHNNPLKVALQKSRNNQHIIKCAGQEVDSITEIAKHLPVQVLHLLNYQLLQTSPEARRKLMDWGVFHVKHSFLSQWREFNQLLRQRNALLRQQRRPDAVWDDLWVKSSYQVHEMRQEICEGWFNAAKPMISELLELPDITLNYYPGWDISESLNTLLQNRFYNDLQLGYTYAGPQRADLHIKTAGIAAQHVLSQGQQKRLVAALQISQSAWVYQQNTADGVLLIDDLPAELDFHAQQQIMRVLAQMNAQVFLTCVDETTARQFAETLGAKLFHVKHGVIESI
ncbi:MAG: DNA replication/repair protein RecF [Gammaproteobacteria bacterium]|jgi:DNA replication and repair protein RecF